ncbi:acetoacetyl-CoA synthetase [Caerostris extrusa]|uniref:Acetoacetyl-CoA synthetase n=1 Tax=Caerostris extrusa TaxID=172846 RepID=A0AAV4MPL2_CAEEX|nr:acetoacetyl-CoA synthetase [Caerostris extrusa]
MQNNSLISVLKKRFNKFNVIFNYVFCRVFLAVAKDYYVQRVTNKNDTLLSLSPVGWASWNIFVTSMFRGTKLVIYEGTPYFLSPTYIWDLVDEFKLTNLFIAPSVLDIMEKGNYVPTEKHSLESLETFISGTSIVKPNNYNFVYNKVKKDILFTSAYGCTEVFGASLTFDRTLPVYRGEISCPGLAVDLECVDESGKHVVGEIGEIVIKQSSPALPLCLWGDMFHSQFKETYFSKYPGKFCYGDLAIINPITKGIIVYGRSDETFKTRSERLFPQIQDSLCVSQYNKRRDERVVLFVLVRKGYSFDEELIRKIRSTIKNELSEHHVPALILETKAIPHNLNGKKMEILVKKIINKMPYNADTVINPASLKNFENVPPYED